DIFVVNKSDRPGADLFASELQSILELKGDRDRESEKPVWKVPIIPAIATRDEGIGDIVERIIRHREFITKNGHFESHRKLQIKHKIKQIIMRHIREIAEKQFLGEMDIDALTESVFGGEIDPYSAVREYFEKGLGNRD
ncbi:methylmalonyl Co-A mutase-associated GTPase MeaB, partial [bacterium]